MGFGGGEAAVPCPTASVRTPGPPWRGPLAAAVLAAALVRPDLAAAHAVLLRSVPAADGTLPAGHAQIELRFNSRIERAASLLQLEDATGAPRKLPLSDSPADMLRAGAELTPGAHVLRWQVLALDGHLTRGSIAFTVAPEAAPAVVGASAR